MGFVVPTPEFDPSRVEGIDHYNPSSNQQSCQQIPTQVSLFFG